MTCDRAVGVEPQSASGSSTKPCCMWNGIEVDDHRASRSRAVLRALAVAEQLGVVGGVERRPAVVLQRRMVAPDRVDPRDQLREAARLREVADPDLIFSESRYSSLPGFTGHVLDSSKPL